MTSFNGKTRPIRLAVVPIALSIAFGSAVTSLDRLHAQAQKSSGPASSSQRMADGKQWTTQNLNVKTAASYCYENAEPNCRQYGRLYTWGSARRACESLGGGWRLPTDGEWQEMAKRSGGIHADSDGSGKAAYKALLTGGDSGFNALLGGGRSEDGQYARLGAHGFYWTATESNPGEAVFYNFARGHQTLFRQNEGEKGRAFSVRCIKD